jgi:hypothetical protein
MMTKFSLHGALDTDGSARATQRLMAQPDDARAARFSAEPSRHPDDEAHTPG